MQDFIPHGGAIGGRRGTGLPAGLPADSTRIDSPTRPEAIAERSPHRSLIVGSHPRPATYRSTRQMFLARPRNRASLLLSLPTKDQVPPPHTPPPVHAVFRKLPQRARSTRERQFTLHFTLPSQRPLRQHRHLPSAAHRALPPALAGDRPPLETARVPRVRHSRASARRDTRDSACHRDPSPKCRDPSPKCSGHQMHSP